MELKLEGNTKILSGRRVTIPVEALELWDSEEGDSLAYRITTEGYLEFYPIDVEIKIKKKKIKRVLDEKGEIYETGDSAKKAIKDL
jgi:bifunctional DNA-binding transcriptional regulator/antitoxin component of YhaV-PrlF toxin-antitoxin module